MVNDGSNFSSDVCGSGKSASSSLAGTSSLPVDIVDSAVCGVSTVCESVRCVPEDVADSLDVLEYVGLGVACGHRRRVEDIIVYDIIVVPATIPITVYQRMGRERKPPTSRRAGPLRAANRAAKRPNPPFSHITSTLFK